jgi:hypothetical protein
MDDHRQSSDGPPRSDVCGEEFSRIIEPDWESLERMTLQESVGVAVVLAVTTAMAAAIKLGGF